MVQKRFATPERELLKLIEDSKAEKGQVVQAVSIKRRNLSLLSLGAWKGRILFFRDRLRKWLRREKDHPADIRSANLVLILLVAALIFYLMTSVYLSMNELKKIPELKFKEEESTKTLTETSPTVSITKNAVSYYLEKARERDIFVMGKKEVKDERYTAPTSKGIEATQNLKLVGISWSDDPYAMVENTKALKTYFVKRGDKIGKVVVDGVSRDRVILNYEGEKIELK